MLKPPLHALCNNFASQNVMNNNASVKELIPEFYQEDDTFLTNSYKLNLGVRQNDKKVNVTIH